MTISWKTASKFDRVIEKSFQETQIPMNSSNEQPNIPVVTKADFIQALKNAGLGSGDTLMVHSSMKSFGRFDGGPEAVIDALLTLVGEQGTICVPTITGAADDGDKGPLRFDARSTPCWTGALCETLRKRPAARRSAHPTHSIAAVGKLNRVLTDNHHLAETPCGKGSPWMKLIDVKAHLLFVGATLNSCTFLHGIEELANVPYHLKPNPAEAYVTDYDGVEHHGFFKVHLWGSHRRYHQAVLPELQNAGLLRTAQAGNSTLLVVPVAPFLDLAMDRITKDPEWLLAKE